MNTPKFKKRDWIKRKKDGRIAQVVMLLNTCYSLRLTDGDDWWLDYDFQDNWELTDAPPKNKLEDAARLYAIPHYMKDIDVHYIEEYPYDSGLEAAFKAGAKWQFEQNEKDLSEKIAAAYQLGLANKEEQMMNGWLQDRDGCFWDGVNEGKKAMKEQMMKEAVEGEYDSYPAAIYLETPVQGIEHGDKVRIIIIKEDER